MPALSAKRLSLASLAALLLETNRKLDKLIEQQAQNHVVTDLLRKHKTIERADALWISRQHNVALLWAGIVVPSLASIAGVALVILLTR